MSSFPRLHKRRLKRHLPRNRTRRSTAIRVRVMPSLVIMGRITTPPRLTLPTVGRANFYINNCGDIRFGRLESAFAFNQDGVVRRAEKRSRVNAYPCSRLRGHGEAPLTSPTTRPWLP